MMDAKLKESLQSGELHDDLLDAAHHVGQAKVGATFNYMELLPAVLNGLVVIQAAVPNPWVKLGLTGAISILQSLSNKQDATV
jgi:hypothetical protein